MPASSLDVPVRAAPGISHPTEVPCCASTETGRLSRVDFGFMHAKPVRQTFTEALDALVDQIKQDRAILAAVLCGSLSHDTVWAKSDIDLVLITIDDRKVETSGISLNADGVNVHAVLMPRT